MNTIEPVVSTNMSAHQIASELLADEYAAWTHEQALALADMLIECVIDTGQPLDPDRVALRCAWAGYDSKAEAVADYGMHTWEELSGNTQTIELDGGQVLVSAY